MKDAVGDTRERIVMFQTEPLLTAIRADRNREFERVARDRQLLGFGRPRVEDATRPVAIVHGARPVVRQSTGANGPACEAL